MDTHQDSDRSGGCVGDDPSQEELVSVHSFLAHLQTNANVHRDDGFGPCFGKYEVLEHIARGGQSSTFLARDPDLDRHVVLKLYDKRLGDGECKTVIKEGRLLAKIKSPYVVRCHTIGYSSDLRPTSKPKSVSSDPTVIHTLEESIETDNASGNPVTPFLVLERIEGTSLEQLMRLRKFSVQEIRRLISQLAEGLAAAHAIGLIHRDIKPANIMVDREGVPKLIDFGLALPAGETSGRAGTGTAAYMSPEQAQGGVELDQTTDIFGLGAVLYELLTCFAPFRGESRETVLAAARTGVVTPPHELNPSVDRDLARIATECMHVERRKRPQSAVQLAERIARPATTWRRRGLVIAASAACLLGLVWLSSKQGNRVADANPNVGAHSGDSTEAIDSRPPLAGAENAGAENTNVEPFVPAPLTAVHGTRPNILLCISDDQSYRFAGANGDPVVQTPGFDRIAGEGLRFEHAFSDAPVGGPARSALLTGQPIWRLEEAGNSYSVLPSKFSIYTELLAEHGYEVRSTGKKWNGEIRASDRLINPAGRIVHQEFLDPPHDGISPIDYAGNFELFLDELPSETPFCFLVGDSRAASKV